MARKTLRQSQTTNNTTFGYCTFKISNHHRVLETDLASPKENAAPVLKTTICQWPMKRSICQYVLSFSATNRTIDTARLAIVKQLLHHINNQHWLMWVIFIA